MLLHNKKIAIVGGGPGGLTLARLLQMKGVNVKVYERDLNKEARVQGATLDLHQESGLKAISEAGLMEAFKANFRPGADRLRIVDKNATILLDDVDHENGEMFRPEIDRGPLRKILLESLQPETVVWNSHFIEMTPENNGWKLEFKNGSTVYADIVIAADGANSKIRPFITSIQPFYAGVTMVEGSVYDSAVATPQIHALLNGGKLFAIGDDKTLIVSSKGDGSLVFYTGGKTEENWWRNSGIDFSDKKSVIEWFQKEFKGWDSIWMELFENAQLPFTVRPQYCMPLDQSWEALPNLTMLGDAAHLMPPYAGEGVNMAMLDALELRNCLTSELFPDLHTAIIAYERQMGERFAIMGEMTLKQTASLHAPDAIEGMIAMMR